MHTLYVSIRCDTIRCNTIILTCSGVFKGPFGDGPLALHTPIFSRKIYRHNAWTSSVAGTFTLELCSRVHFIQQIGKFSGEGHRPPTGPIPSERGRLPSAPTPSAPTGPRPTFVPFQNPKYATVNVRLKASLVYHTTLKIKIHETKLKTKTLSSIEKYRRSRKFCIGTQARCMGVYPLYHSSQRLKQLGQLPPVLVTGAVT